MARKPLMKKPKAARPAQRPTKRQGIRRRWMLNSISVVLLVVVIAVTAFTLAMSGYYYSTMGSSLENQAQTATNIIISTSTSQSMFTTTARNYVSTATERDRLEFQLLSSSGRVLLSSSNLTAGTVPGTGDITEAITSKKTSGVWTGSDPSTGEHIMAVSSPMLHNGTLVGVLRIVTSLSAVDSLIVLIAGLSILVGLFIVVLVYVSNLYFIRSILDPVANVTETAKRIAAGSYGVQMEKKFDDEIGDLTDAINDMSMKINQSEKVKSDFISSVSHELRTPLTAINGWAETILNGEVQDPQDARKGMGIIVSEARRLTNMVEELLEFSRIEDGRFTLSMEPLDIKAELEDAVYTYKEFFRRKGLTLEYDECEEELPILEGDPQRLRQVFCNLLDNADKHGGSGKRVDVSIRPEGDMVLIAIRDYGPGIPEEELPHVKYKFYKGSSKARGSGIGLAVCEEIVTRHNGTLTMANAEGGGCVATIALPLGT